MKKEKQKTDHWALRANLTREAQKKVGLVQAKQFVAGNHMTQDQTLEFIIKNFK